MTKPGDKLRDLLSDFDTAMLVTRTGQGQLRARPMSFAEIESDGTLWFLTARHSAKSDEIALDSHVNVNMQSKRKFVSVSGTAAIVEDQAKLATVWKAAFQVWFPGGQDDPDLVLLRVHCESGEYWDYGGASGIKYLIEAGKAYLSGTRPEVEHDAKVHDKVGL